MAEPHASLGLHPNAVGDLEFHALLPGAKAVELVDLTVEPPRCHDVPDLGGEGLFGFIAPGHRRPFRHCLRVAWIDGTTEEFFDPYAFDPTLTESDLVPFNRGEDPLAYRKFGAQARVINAVPGYGFTVWAPRADGVSLIGDFNGWDERRHRMRRLGKTGVWELFVPGLAADAQYKYRVFSRGVSQDKADPFATYSEGAPGNASLTCDLGGRSWDDAGQSRPEGIAFVGL